MTLLGNRAGGRAVFRSIKPCFGNGLAEMSHFVPEMPCFAGGTGICPDSVHPKLNFTDAVRANRLPSGYLTSIISSHEVEYLLER